MPILLVISGQVLVLWANNINWWDEHSFLDLLVALIHSVNESRITFTNFLHSLIGIFSVVKALEFQVSRDDTNEVVASKCNLPYASK